jgi:glycosyltransferase 2 family protein
MPRSRKAILFIVLANLASFAMLAWVLGKVDTRELWKELRSANYAWIAVAVVTDILVYVIQGWRWRLLLSPLGDIKALQCIRAIYVGLFANELLPFRSGEVIRCYLLSRWTSLPLPVIFSSALLERIFDGIWLVVSVGVVLQLLNLTNAAKDGGYALIAFIALLVLALGSLVAFRSTLQPRLAQHATLRWLGVVIDDLVLMGSSRSFFKAFLVSGLYLFSMALPIWCMLQAYGIRQISVGEVIATNLIIRLGTMLPSAPGNLGSFQLALTGALLLFGVQEGLAARFAVVMWGVVTLPLLAVGFVALLITGFRFRELLAHAEASGVDHRRPDAPA